MVAGSLDKGAIAGKTYSGKTFASERGSLLTKQRHDVSVSSAETRTFAELSRQR